MIFVKCLLHWMQNIPIGKYQRVLYEKEKRFKWTMPPDVSQDNAAAAQEEYDEDGFLLMASDGACPGQHYCGPIQRTGGGLYVADNHVANVSVAVHNVSQGAQRGELHMIKQWVSWA